MARVKPKTQRETLDQVWYAVLGTNGDGLIDRVTRLEERPRSQELVDKDRRTARQSRISTAVNVTVLVGFLLTAMGFRAGWFKQAVQRWMDEPVVEVVQ